MQRFYIRCMVCNKSAFTSLLKQACHVCRQIRGKLPLANLGIENYLSRLGVSADSGGYISNRMAFVYYSCKLMPKYPLTYDNVSTVIVLSLLISSAILPS